jgi:hypothetical protein
MKTLYILLTTLLLSVSPDLFAQNDPSLLRTKVVSFSDKAALSEYVEAELDTKYPNLMSPENQKNNSEEIMSAWKEIHQQVYGLTVASGFDWGVPDENIQLLHKIYFDKEGKVEYYFFRVFNDDVSEEKKKAFQDLLDRHLHQLSISFSQDTRFAQCGKSAYPNPGI